MEKPVEATIRLRMNEKDVHYAGGIVNGSKMLDLFGDVATELLIRNDGDEGLFRAYQEVEFLAPVKSGDFIEARGEITRVGNSSREMKFEAYKVIENAGIEEQTSACNVLEEPVLVCKAKGTCVVPKDMQRGKQE
ncbi:hotdog fold domain-containing protein [Natranaerobius thermophilus]|uniref:3-aminobutyryl-CoA ammonia-lyase n=1 Tax=Natranaerobius thermophilus (strain ATCC BAA-1301 / DSM 18059 / JW/NM-WN-LF) TaxID=457570 RepID=B2A637_NATTJ|nr:hotdog fold domain-containing protein [Natranaerobius thermophilus]ACB85454.1 3-aminobutyryl-CoA ammonia-lyase [Natranaerobius thermophilus JW/NM-WN-LF]